jgi:hypothetical protein
VADIVGNGEKTVVAVDVDDEDESCNLGVTECSQRETGGVTTRTVTDTKLRHPIAGEKTPDLLVLIHARTTFLFCPAFVPYP